MPKIESLRALESREIKKKQMQKQFFAELPVVQPFFK